MSLRSLVQVSFHKTRDSLVSRPWVVDDLDASLEYFRRSPPRKAVMFCDNAGSDVILGKSCATTFDKLDHSPVSYFCTICAGWQVCDVNRRLEGPKIRLHW